MATAVAWDAVASAAIDGQTDRRLDSCGSERREFGDSERRPVVHGACRHCTKRQAAARLGFAPRVRVRSLQIVDACLVNLDRDVEPDGISRSRMAAIGDDGRPTAVRGSLTARLFGEQRPNDVAIVAFPELDHWTQPVRPADFVDGVATYELRFRGTAPEWQYDLLPDAVLDVTLGAFGQGNYAASTPVVSSAVQPAARPPAAPLRLAVLAERAPRARAFQLTRDDAMDFGVQATSTPDKGSALPNRRASAAKCRRAYSLSARELLLPIEARRPPCRRSAAAFAAARQAPRPRALRSRRSSSARFSMRCFSSSGTSSRLAMRESSPMRSYLLLEFPRTPSGSTSTPSPQWALMTASPSSPDRGRSAPKRAPPAVAGTHRHHRVLDVQWSNVSGMRGSYGRG